MVGLPLGSTFCKTLENMSKKPGKNLFHTHLQRINSLAGRIKMVHQMHCGRAWDEERPRIDFYGLIDGWQKADDSTLSRFEDRVPKVPTNSLSLASLLPGRLLGQL